MAMPPLSAGLQDGEFTRNFENSAQEELLYEAVRDAQATIRAIDTKVGILLAALAIPLPYIITAVNTAHHRGVEVNFTAVCGWFALAAYVLAGLIAIRALTGIGNAAGHVSRTIPAPDVFYLRNLYDIRWIDSIWNRRGNRSRRNVEEIVAEVPRKTTDVLRVLVDQLTILAYVRDIKVFRQRVAFEFTALAFVLGLLSLI